MGAIRQIGRKRVCLKPRWQQSMCSENCSDCENILRSKAIICPLSLDVSVRKKMVKDRK
jgi:hypothetical protein